MYILELQILPFRGDYEPGSKTNDNVNNKWLTFTTFWTNSADDKLMIFLLSLIFLEEKRRRRKKKKRFDISCKLYLHEKLNSFFWKTNKKNISICRLLKFLSRVLRVKQSRGPHTFIGFCPGAFSF